MAQCCRSDHGWCLCCLGLLPVWEGSQCCAAGGGVRICVVARAPAFKSGRGEGSLAARRFARGCWRTESTGSRMHTPTTSCALCRSAPVSVSAPTCHLSRRQTRRHLSCVSPPHPHALPHPSSPSPRLRAVAAKQQHPAPATATRRGGASRRRRRSRQGLLTKDRGGWRTGRPHGLHQLQLGCRLNARGTCRNFPRRKRATLRRTGRLQDGPPDPDD